MERLHRGSCASGIARVVRLALVGALVLGVAAGVGCYARGSVIRYGSLVVEERIIRYRHGVESFTMANGLVVALLPDAQANLVSVDMRYRVGAADEPADKAGLAHFVEHLTFAQAPEPGGPTLTDQLALAALTHNAETGWDATHYHEVALAEKLSELLAIEATRMTRHCAGLDQAIADHERAVIDQEIAQRGTNLLRDAVLGDLFGAGHRYARSVGGDDITGLTLDDVCSFLDTHYRPEQAILVIAGRFEAEAARRLLATHFAGIPRHPLPAHAAPPPLAMRGTTSTHHADTDHPVALVVFPAARWGSPASFDDDLLDQVIVQRLGRLRRDRGWVTGLDAGHLGGHLDGARYFALSVADPARLDDAIAAIFDVVRDLPGNDGWEALGALAARRRTDLFSELESVFDRGSHCADYLQFTYHNSFHLPELAALQVIETDRLLLRARRLTRANSHVVKVLPGPATSARSSRPALQTAAAIDAQIWRAPVDPAEADRPMPLPPQRASAPVTELRLPNGLRVWMVPELSQPVIEARMVFPIGAFNAGSTAPELVEATAALLDHDPEVKTLKDFTIVDWALRLGTQVSYDVDDATTFSVRGTSTFADWHVWRLHWLLENGTYDVDDVRRARAAAERAARRDTGAHWRRAIREALFGAGHPYARRLGTPAGLSPRQLEAFRDAHYRANGATLIIVGQFDLAAMTRTVTELFGAWEGDPPPPPTPVPAMRPVAGPTWLAHDDPDASQIRLALTFAARSPREPSRGARAVVAEMVRTRLDEVRTRLGATYGMQVAYQTTEAGDALQMIGQIDAHRAGEVIQLVQRHLEGLRAGDEAFAADFVRARRTALARALADPVISTTVAAELEAAVTKHRAIDAGATLPAAIAATTLGDVRVVLAADLQPARMVGLLGGPRAEVAAAFAAAHLRPTRMIESVAGR
jgi:zinc protease